MKSLQQTHKELDSLLAEYSSSSEQEAVTNLIKIHEKLLKSKWFSKTMPIRQRLLINLKQLDESLQLNQPNQAIPPKLN